LLDPIGDVFEGLLVSDRVHEDNARRSLIVGFCDGFEPLLTSSVPNLHFDVDSIDGKNLNFIVDANSGDVADFVLVVDEAKQDIGFPNSTIPN
jgi:hypothetical protein